MSVWPVLVTLHNLVNIPVEACEGPVRTFTVEAHLQPRVSAYAAPAPIASFSTADVICNTPHLFEVRLDEIAGQTDHAKVWRSSLPDVEVVVEVREMRHGAGGSRAIRSDRRGEVIEDSESRLVGRCTPFRVSVRDVLESKKMTTRLVGTEMGQVGISFTVDASDKTGYRHRLEAFLQQYNPSGLRLVPTVVDTIPELDTFTKLYKKYGQCDYSQRLHNFFDMYGPQYKTEIPSLMSQWEGREEELMRNLVLDNGPEMDCVEASQRLTAYLTMHHLRRDTPAVAALLKDYAGEEADLLFRALVAQFGAEPDPRTYLFPRPRYVGAAAPPREERPSSAAAPPPPPPTRRPILTASTASTPEVRPAPPAAAAKQPTPTRSPPPRPSEERYLSIAMTPPRPADTTTTTGGGGGFIGNVSYGSSTSAAAPPSPPLPRTGLGEPLWRRLCAAVQATAPRSTSARRPPWREYQLFYMREAAFVDLVHSLQTFTREEQQQLEEEWRLRVRQALREDPVPINDAYYSAIVQEAAQLVRLQPLHLQVLSAATVFHKEHYAGYSAAMESAKEAKTERLVLAGSLQQLRDVVRYGVGGEGLPLSAPSGWPATFLAEPFRHWTEPHPIALLICDVAVGRQRHCDAAVRVPEPPSAAFLADYDSCVYEDEAGGPAVVVPSPQQVFPRVLLQCTVDPLLLPCPSHPSKAVEYYIPEAHAFACSRCVVMGEFKGKEVLPIDEAATQSRARMADLQRTTDAIKESMLAYLKQIHLEEAQMPTAPRRVQAEREMERIRREAEEKIGAIQRKMEAEDASQMARLSLHREESTTALQTAERLYRTLDAAIHGSTAIGAVRALQRVQQERQVEQLLATVQERMPSAPLEKVLPLDDEASSHRRRVPRKGGRPSSASAMGLNESHMSTSRLPLMEDTTTTGGEAVSELHAKYLSLSGEGTVTPPGIVVVRDRLSAKEALTRGWALLRQGNSGAARRQWETVCKMFGEGDVLCTKARAYIAETIDKDYHAAARWYARSLQLDPQDRITTYNYAVLLEALLGEPDEALSLYERAAAMGDAVAQARAKELRAKRS